MSGSTISRTLAQTVGVAWILALVVPTVMAAQTATPPDSNSFCFRGRPLPACRSFLLLEIGTGGRLLPSHQPADNSLVPEEGGNFGAVTIGMMRNRPDRTAIGGALEVGGGEWPRKRYAIEYRRRKWLNNWVAIDAAAGPLMIDTHGSTEPLAGGTNYGLTSHVGLVLGDLATVTTGLDLVHSQHHQVTLTGGARLGSWGTLSVAALAAVFLLGLAHSSNY
jgi:hypothetical protein